MQENREARGRRRFVSVASERYRSRAESDGRSPRLNPSGQPLSTRPMHTDQVVSQFDSSIAVTIMLFPFRSVKICFVIERVRAGALTDLSSGMCHRIRDVYSPTIRQPKS